jgi:prefoldin subunit 5
MTVNVYHKHSVVKEKAPDAKQIELGEVGINANQDSPALYIKDSADQVRKVGGDIVAIEEELTRLNFVLSQLQDVIDVLDNFDGSGLQKLIKALGALEAQCVLLAKHNVEQDRDIDGLQKDVAAIQAELLKIDANINSFAQDIADLKTSSALQKVNIEKNENRLDVLETMDVTGKGDVKVEQKDTYKWEITLDETAVGGRLDQLETVDVTAGNGIIVEQTETYKWKVRVDVAWLDAKISKMISDALNPYALKDISENTPELDGA